MFISQIIVTEENKNFQFAVVIIIISFYPYFDDILYLRHINNTSGHIWHMHLQIYVFYTN